MLGLACGEHQFANATEESQFIVDEGAPTEPELEGPRPRMPYLAPWTTVEVEKRRKALQALEPSADLGFLSSCWLPRQSFSQFVSSFSQKIGTTWFNEETRYGCAPRPAWPPSCSDCDDR